MVNSGRIAPSVESHDEPLVMEAIPGVMVTWRSSGWYIIYVCGRFSHALNYPCHGQHRQSDGLGWLLEFYDLAASKVMLGQAPICDSAHSW